jgi:hypothetical protein
MKPSISIPLLDQFRTYCFLAPSIFTNWIDKRVSRLIAERRCGSSS